MARDLTKEKNEGVIKLLEKIEHHIEANDEILNANLKEITYEIKHVQIKTLPEKK